MTQSKSRSSIEVKHENMLLVLSTDDNFNLLLPFFLSSLKKIEWENVTRPEHGLEGATIEVSSRFEVLAMDCDCTKRNTEKIKKFSGAWIERKTKKHWDIGLNLEKFDPIETHWC